MGGFPVDTQATPCEVVGDLATEVDGRTTKYLG
jgi:hypothetical protein